MANQLPEIRKTVVLKVPVEKAWKAIATSEGIAGWFMDNTFEPEVGKEFVLHAGPYGDSVCKVTEVTPHSKVSFDWDKDWHLTFELREIDSQTTEFTLIHSGWDADTKTSFGQPHPVVRGFMDQGWEKKVQESLPAYIEG